MNGAAILADAPEYSDLDCDTDHVGSSDESSLDFTTNLNAISNNLNHYPPQTDPLPIKVERTSHHHPLIDNYQNTESRPSNHSNHVSAHRTTIKREPVDREHDAQRDHDIEMDDNHNSITNHRFLNNNFKRSELEKLSLDELLAKTLAFKPNLRWNIHNEWCRYCGARGSASFSCAAKVLLCAKHHSLWRENQLDLSLFAIPEDIESVAHKTECTERDYLIDILLTECHNTSLSPYCYARRLRSGRNRNQATNINNIKLEDYLSSLSPSEASSNDDSESSNSSYSESSESEESQSYQMHDRDAVDAGDDEAIYGESIIKTEPGMRIKREKHGGSEWNHYKKYDRKVAIVKVECTQCAIQFVAHAKYRKHMNKIHGVTQPYKCDLCPDTKETRYSNKAGLDKHIKRDHEKIRDFKCKLCPKSFYEKSVLEQHQRVHDGKKPFKCAYCKMRFTQRNSHKQHIIAVHFKQKNYECKYCGKKFAALTTMKSHVVSVHNDVQYTRFQCDICCKRFYEKGGYLKHKENAHRPVDPIKEAIKRGECIFPGCDKKYNSKNAANSVRSHLVSAHRDRRYAKYECKKCDKLFYDKTSYTKHMSAKHQKKRKKHKKNQGRRR